MRIDPGRLLLLHAIHRRGSITGAASAAGRTPPAVSQQLNRMEREVGAQLVERQRHGVRLTPLGARLAAHAERLAEALHHASEDATGYLDEHRNRLRLGAFPTAGLALLPEALAALRHHTPEVELSVVDLGPAEGITLVTDDVLDLALVGEYGEPLRTAPGASLVTLVHDPVFAVLPDDHTLAKGEAALHLSDSRAEPWASAPMSLPNRRQLEEIAREEGFTPHVPFEPESYAVAQAIVSAGVAVAFVPELALSRAPGIVARPMAEPSLYRRIHAVVPSSAGHSPLTTVFLQILQDVCAELPR